MTPDRDDRVEVPDTKAIGETEKALLIRFDDGEEEWVPKSQVTDDSEVWERGHEGKLVVTFWWADKAGRA